MADELTPDELLSTTRAVRKRLDFSKPVPDDLVRECVALAMQSPSGSNASEGIDAFYEKREPNWSYAQ